MAATITPTPDARRNFIPVGFVPRQNPFYVALPYNDVEGGHTKYEASQVIPWFKQAFVRDGQTVLKGRWIAIRHGNRVCYAQWEDCGPFRTDHWQYVFGNERPRPNLNQGAGLDVSPAVRDYLGLGNKDACDWKFVEFREVPLPARGPCTAITTRLSFCGTRVTIGSRAAVGLKNRSHRVTSVLLRPEVPYCGDPEFSFRGLQKICLVQVDGPVERQELDQMIQSQSPGLGVP